MLRHSPGFRIAIALTLLAGGSAAAAPTLSGGVGPTGKDGELQINDGTRVLARVKPVTPALRRGTPLLREHSLEGRRVLELRIPVRGTPSEEVWLGEVPATGVSRPIWSGLTGPRDADGESSLNVEIADGKVLEFQRAVQVVRCDGQPVRLFPRAWDFAAGRFVPTAPPLPPAPAQTIVARRADPAMPATPALHAFRWTSASTTAGAGTDARMLGAPGALDDGQAGTAWKEGVAGDGRGEFLTARTSTGPVPVLGLRLLPGDASSPDAFRKHGRPRVLRLSLGPRPEQQFRVELQDGGDPGQPYWIALPASASSGCMTLALEEVAPGSDVRAGTAISEIEVVTELDGTGGPERLARELGRGGDCTARVSLLVAFGKPALLPAARAAAEARGLGRECLVEAITRLEPAPSDETVVAALVGALRGASAREEQLVVPVLHRVPGAVAAVAALLGDASAPDGDRARAARVLGGLEQPEAARALLAAAGTGGEAVRAAVADAAARCPVLSPELVAGELQRDAQAPAARRGELLRLLALRAQTDLTAGARAAAVIRDALAAATDFELQARALRALGALPHPAAVDELAAVRAHSNDGVLRFLATRELAGNARPEVVAPLRLALADADPRVRETAAMALGGRKDRESSSALVAASKQEAWPFARRAQVDAIGRLCTADGADLLMRAAEVDVPEVRATAMAALVRCRDARAAGLLLATLDRRAEGAGLRENAARLLGLVRHSALAAALARSVREILVESEADMALEAVAAAALPSLARQGGPDAVKTAVDLVGDRRPVIRRAAVEALGILCDPTSGAAALHGAATGKDPAIATMAASLEKRCAARKK